MSTAAQAVQLVLVEPSGPLNIGSVARLCANFGVSGLRLVAPRCDPLAEEARRMAVHALPLLEAARVLPDLDAALADCGRVVAASGRGEGDPLAVVSTREALAWLLQCPTDRSAAPAAARSSPERPVALVFGREDRGLSRDELLRAGRILRIAADPGYSSLNLSHAVAVVLHALHELRSAPVSMDPPSMEAAGPGGEPPEPCLRQELEAALQDAQALLLETGFLLPHTTRARMAKLRALLQRAQVSQGEVALLRGMVCQLRWASRRPFPAAEDH